MKQHDLTKNVNLLHMTTEYCWTDRVCVESSR